MSAARGAAIVVELVRRGVLGMDPELLLDLSDLCRLAGVSMDLFDLHTRELAELRTERDRIAADLARTQTVLREYESRVESDRAAGLRVIADLRAENARLKATLSEAAHGPDLDMAMLEQLEGSVSPGSRTGDAVAREEERRRRRAA